MMDRVLFVIVDHDEDPQLKIHRLIDFVDCKVGSWNCLNVLLWYIMVCCVFCITTNHFVTITYISSQYIQSINSQRYFSFILIFFSLLIYWKNTFSY